MEERLSTVFNFSEMFFLGIGERGALELGGAINYGSDTGLEFKIKPEKKIGFIFNDDLTLTTN